jgi:hypothetical protein
MKIKITHYKLKTGSKYIILLEDRHYLPATIFRTSPSLS